MKNFQKLEKHFRNKNTPDPHSCSYFISEGGKKGTKGFKIRFGSLVLRTKSNPRLIRSFFFPPHVQLRRNIVLLQANIWASLHGDFV